MTQPITDHRKGLALTALGGLALTADIPLIKLADGDIWTILLLRTGTTLAVALAAWFVWKNAGRNAPRLVPGRPGLFVAMLYGVSSLCFVSAVFHTSTANLVFIVAFSPIFATALAWGFLGERPRPPTLAAMALTVVGVAVIVQDGLGSGGWFGDLLALCAAFLLASAITVTRRSGLDMGFTALVAAALPFSVAALAVLQNGFHVAAPGWIVLNGALVIPLAFFCLATGPKYISGAEVAMFYLLETVLAPVWVWLIFSEAPTAQVLAGGALLIGTLLAHSLWQLAENRRRRAALAVKHPV